MNEVASILNNLDSSIESVINESEKLATTITDTVVPGILDEIEAVRAETDAYMQNRDAIYDVIKAKEELASNLEVLNNIKDDIAHNTEKLRNYNINFLNFYKKKENAYSFSPLLYLSIASFTIFKAFSLFLAFIRE